MLTAELLTKQFSHSYNSLDYLKKTAYKNWIEKKQDQNKFTSLFNFGVKLDLFSGAYLDN